MRAIIQKKTAVLPGIVFFLLLFTLFVSCKKDINNDTPAIPEEVPDLSSKINSSVSGFVTNENNAPVVGASVQVGTASTITDQFGFFQVKNVEVVKTAAVVTITNNGYFKAIKTWAATEGKAAFFRIKLLPKTISGTINASTGGNISLPNGLTIALPSNSVVIASSNTAYNGGINVAAQWLDPEASDLNQVMPGDLRAIDENGYMKILTTFGMAAVELTSSSGELLQIAPGKEATITMPLSATVSAAAPSSIPLWYFDEDKGLWKEEGAATKTGNAYVGNVSHFTFWNCDLPNATVPLTFTVVDGEGNPVSNIFVQIKPVTGSPYSWGAAGGYTEASGFAAVFVTANTTYNLQIFDNTASCGLIPVYNQAFSVATTAVSLGNIVFSNTSTIAIAIVSGSLTDCNGNILINGHVTVEYANVYNSYPLDNNGNYQFSTVICGSSNAISITAVDPAQNQQSLPQPVMINAGENTIPVIQACGSPILNYISNGYFYHPTAPRSISNYPKTLDVLNATSVICGLGDLGAQGFYAILEVDPTTNHITISAAPGASSGPYYQWDAGLPTSNPPYSPAWLGSAQCNNSYDPGTLTYYLRYGYIGGTGYRVSEEILTP